MVLVWYLYHSDIYKNNNFKVLLLDNQYLILHHCTGIVTDTSMGGPLLICCYFSISNYTLSFKSLAQLSPSWTHTSQLWSQSALSESTDLIWPLDSPFVLSPQSCSACQRLNTVLFCCVNCILSRGVIVTSNVPRAVNMEGRCLSMLHLDTATTDWQLPVFIAHSFPGDIILRCWSIMNSKHLCSIVDGNNDVYVVMLVWHHTQMLIMNTTSKHLRLTQYCWWHQQCLCCDYLSYAVNIATATWWCVKFSYDTAMVEYWSVSLSNSWRGHHMTKLSEQQW